MPSFTRRGVDTKARWIEICVILCVLACFGVSCATVPRSALGRERSDVREFVDAHLLHRGLKSVEFDASCVSCFNTTRLSALDEI